MGEFFFAIAIIPAILITIIFFAMFIASIFILAWGTAAIIFYLFFGLAVISYGCWDAAVKIFKRFAGQKSEEDEE